MRNNLPRTGWTISYSPRAHGHRESSTRADDKKPKQEGGTHASQDCETKRANGERGRGGGELRCAGELFKVKQKVHVSRYSAQMPLILLKIKSLETIAGAPPTLTFEA